MGTRIGAIFCLLFVLCAGAGARDAPHGPAGPRIDANLRVYDFTRAYRGAPADQRAFDAGVALGAHSGALMGWSLGAVFYATHPLGSGDANPALVDATLAGYSPIAVLGQAFLQYRVRHLLVRAGDQLIRTPWINPGDSRLVPAAYRALVAVSQPLAGLCIEALWLTAFKSRTSNAFTPTDLYNASGTLNVGGAGGLADRTERGATAFGVVYRDALNRAKAWAYAFTDLADLVILQERHDFGRHDWHPFVGGQWIRETADGARYLGAVNATAYGAMLGVARRGIEFSVRYNDIPAHPGAFAGGGVVSPYTSGYGTDPLYTTTMSQSLVDQQAPGHAVALRLQGLFRRRSVRLGMGYARYGGAPAGLAPASGSSAVDFDVAYYFRGPLRGLSMRDRVAMIDSVSATDRFIYNRFMFQYRIGTKAL
ncbi:MAG: OprD family outer membrane porin [Gammaproteobacteria bacterium]|nr:OprD family outer membrane porin [Gammaproteobacteria bacterium]